MIAWITRGVWLAIAGAFAMFAFHFHLAWGWALVATAALILAVKFAITTVNFAVAAWANRNDPVGFKLHPMRFLYGFMEEQMATTASFGRCLGSCSKNCLRPQTHARIGCPC
jgi:hypothetical protein